MLSAFGGLVLDEVRHEVRLDGDVVDLRPAEYALLAALMRRPGAAISSRQLLKAMWGVEWHADTTSLQVHVSRLRRKLGESAASPRHIVTVHGFGYRFETDPVGSPDHRPSAEGDDQERDDEPAGAPVCVLMSPGLVIEWVSEHVRDLLGWDPLDLVGVDAEALVHPDDVLRRDEEADLLAGQPLTWEGRLRTASGDYRATAAAVRPVVDAESQVTGLLASWASVEAGIHDVRLEPIRLNPNASTDPATRSVTLTYDQDLVLREVTPRKPFLGWEPDEVVDRFFALTAITEEGAHTFVRTLLEAGATDHGGTYEVRHKDGTVMQARVDTRIDREPCGSFAGLRATWHLP